MPKSLQARGFPAPAPSAALASGGQRGLCAVSLTVLAEWVGCDEAGRQSSRLFTDACLWALLRMLQNDRHPAVQLHALLALEKFALTRTSLASIGLQLAFLSKRMGRACRGE
jgi:hypothetical protein